MKKPTEKQIGEQIKWFEENKEKIVHYSVFGDDNWEKVDVVLDVLRGESTPSDYENGETEQEMEICACADEVFGWMEGKVKKSPMLNWNHLAKKEGGKK